MMENKIRKFKGFWIVVILSLFVFAACTNDVDSDEYEESDSETLEETLENDYETLDEDEESDYETSDDALEERAELGPNGFPLIYLTEEARDIVLEDFDYLTELMLENAPQQGIFLRRFDISLEDALMILRNEIYTMQPVESVHFFLMGEDMPNDELSTEARYLAAEYLASLLMWFQIEIESLGHFGPQMLDTYWEMLEANSAMLHQAEVIDGRVVLDGEEGGDVRSLEHLVDVLSSEATLWFFDVELDDVDLYRDMEDIGFREENNVITDIIEDDQVAYVRINSFMNNGAFDSEVLFPFFEEVQEFEHLIIDLRGNGGGWPIYFQYYIAAMLIDEPIDANFNELLTEGDIARRLAEYSLLGSVRGVATDDIILAYDFVNDGDFPYFNEDDLDILQYVIQWHLEIEPREENIPFAGDIWLLVDESSASASELAAMIAMDSDFATVVGEPTAGVTAVKAMFISLPNTGILFRVDTGYLIDESGRSLEEFGVTPEIVIDPGSDALDVVLDLIQ